MNNKKKAKKIILTQNQIDEICGNNYAYLNDLALKPDIGNIYGNEITTDGALENGYPTPTTTDEKARTMVNNTNSLLRTRGLGSTTIREMSKKDWEKTIIEDVEHGNKLLNNRKFNDKSYSAAKMANSRKKKAENVLIQSKNNGDKIGAQKAANTLRDMKQNGTLEAGELYRNTQKGLSNANISAPMKSAPKTGKGTAHTPKNGIFIN